MGTFLAPLGAVCCCPGVTGSIWAMCGALSCVARGSWGLGDVLGQPGVLLGCLGCLLSPSGRVLEASWAPLGSPAPSAALGAKCRLAVRAPRELQAARPPRAGLVGQGAACKRTSQPTALAPTRRFLSRAAQVSRWWRDKRREKKRLAEQKARRQAKREAKRRVEGSESRLVVLGMRIASTPSAAPVPSVDGALQPRILCQVQCAVCRV